MIKNILKGSLMGIANIIPGVSGGTMAVSMGIYDKLIHCITHLFSEFKKSLAFLIPIFIGAAIGLVGLSFAIEWLFDIAPLETNFMFIGLIVGGFPAIWAKVKGEQTKGTKISIGHIIIAILFFALVAGLAAFGDVGGTDKVLTPSVGTAIQMLLVGIIASATMIIPGVSGSMVLLLLGYYNTIVAEINDFIRALIAFDIEALVRGCMLFVPLGIGIIVGIFGIAKGIEIVFEKFPMYAYFAIVGLIVASPVAILLLSTFGTITMWNILLGVVTFVLGCFIAFKLGD
ncbi:MAG: DUF368 domain-containing protein [Lachnospiraceae bacterium]